jgi:5S rRNA maturation endonuclease (ribonuclease M5)
MGNNSVKSAQRVYDYIADAMLSRNTPKKPGIIVVEGKNDIAFFRRFCAGTAEVVTVDGGKQDVTNVILDFPENKPYRKYVIGVCDRDYDETLQNDRLFYYDFCNLEMMIISNEISRKKLSESVPQNVEIYDILKELLPRSCLRKASSQNKLNLKLSKYDIKVYHNDYSENPESVTLNQYNLFSLHTKLDDSAKGTLKNEIKSTTDIEQMLYITQGHDFRAIFGFYVSSKKHFDEKSDTVFELLLASFGESEFRSTDLYKKISVYGETYGIGFFTC